MSIGLGSGYTQNLGEAINGMLIAALDNADAKIDLSDDVLGVYERADDEFRSKWEATMIAPWWLGEQDAEAPGIERFFRDTDVTFEESDDHGGVNIWCDQQWAYGWIRVVDGYQWPEGYDVEPSDIDDDDWAESLDDDQLEKARDAIRAGRKLVEEISDWICNGVEEAIKAKAGEIEKSAVELGKWSSTDDEECPFPYDEYAGYDYVGEDADEYDDFIFLDRNWQRTVQRPYEQYHVDEHTVTCYGIKF